MSNINICFSSDNNYAKYMGIAMCSILKNANKNDTYNFYILDGGISDKFKEEIAELKAIKDFSIEYLKINPEDFKSCPMTGYVNYITLPTYYRFKIASMLPQVDKILYLDGDIIVDSDIKEMFETNIDDYYIGAIPEVYNHDHKERLEIFGDEYYFNAGVLLINSKKWREDNIEEKLFAYALNPEREIVFQDQDILNEVLKYKIKYLPLKWNLQHDALFRDESYLYHKEERLEAIKAPKLVHFTHKFKPWNPKCFNKYRYLFYQYLKLTPWKSDYVGIRLGTIKVLIGKFLKNLLSIENVTKRNTKYKILKLLGVKITLKKKVLYNKIIGEMFREKEKLIERKIDEKLTNFQDKNYNQLLDMLTQIFLEDNLKNNTLNIKDIFNDAKTISVSHWANNNEEGVQFFRNFLNLFDKNVKLNILNEINKKDTYSDAYFCWGTRSFLGQMLSVYNAKLYKKPLVVVEDGFLRSIVTNACATTLNKFNTEISFTFDTKSPYYDARNVSDLENMLNDKSLVITEEQKQRARNCINRIVDTYLSKYNSQPIYEPRIGREGVKKVLVIDQSYGDMSIAKGLASDYTFENMLECAIKENPDADIIVKSPPDTIAGGGATGGYYKGLQAHNNIYTQTEPINPISLIKYVDKVYVCTTQFGFEALMCGKEVQVFGMPFYAGWGLTNDRQTCSRRTNVRTLEEIFYITYIMYTYYVNPKTENICEIEDAMDYLLALRDEYFKTENIESVNYAKF